MRRGGWVLRSELQLRFRQFQLLVHNTIPSRFSAASGGSLNALESSRRGALLRLDRRQFQAPLDAFQTPL